MREYFLALTPEHCNTASLDATIRRMDQEFEKGLDTGKRERFQKIQVQMFKENPNYTRSIPGVLEFGSSKLESRFQIGVYFLLGTGLIILAVLSGLFLVYLLLTLQRVLFSPLSELNRHM